nr:hypothetical protein [uncultured Carboxylicivirga sp.]
MKKAILFTIFIITITLGAIQNSTAQKPEKMGHISFKILKKINNWDTQTYNKYMVSINDLYQTLGVSEPNAEMQAKWEKELKKVVERVRKDGEFEGIDWKKIKYVDFTYKVELKGNVSIYEGDLIFSENNKNYKIEIGYLDTDKGLKIGNLEDLHQIE